MPSFAQADFSGGLFDNPMDAPNNGAQRLQNLLLDSNAKPYQRPFVKPLFSTHQGWTAPCALGSLFDRLFFIEQATGDVYFQETSGTRTALSTAGPFSSASKPPLVSWEAVDGHLFTAADVLSGSVKRVKPTKIYFDQSNEPDLVTAGLPRPGKLSMADTGTFGQNKLGDALIGVIKKNGTAIPAAPPEKGVVILLRYNGVAWRGDALYASSEAEYSGTYISNTSGRDFLWQTSETNATNLDGLAVSITEYFESMDVYAVRKFDTVEIYFRGYAEDEKRLELSVVLESGGPYFTVFNAQSDTAYSTYNYSVIYKREYVATKTFGGEPLTFIDRGAPANFRMRWETADALQLSINSQLDLEPFLLANAGRDEYDTASTKIEVYRSTTEGSEQFLVGELPNTAPAGFYDAIQDEDLVFKLPAYWNGGVLYNDRPPECRFIASVASAMWYGNIIDVTAGETEEHVVVQSKLGDHDSVPAGNRLEFDDAVTGIGGHDNIPIVGTLNGVYRVEGVFDDLGVSSARHVRFSKDTGIVSHHSIVRTDLGMFFAGTDGFYWTDGYRVRNVSPGLNATYLRFVNGNRPVFGAYQKTAKRVIWTVDFTEEGSTTWRSGAFVLDLNFNFMEGSGMTGPFLSQDPTKAASLQVQDYWGQVTCTDEGNLYMSPRQRTSGTATNWLFALTPFDVFRSGDFVKGSTTEWRTVPVTCSLKSISTNFGEPRAKKWVTGIKTSHRVSKEFLGKRTNSYVTYSSYACEPSMATQIVSNNDNGRRIHRMKSIYDLTAETDVIDPNFSNETLPAVGFYQGGSQEYKWNFPAKGLRCNYKQVEIASGLAVFAKSQDAGTGTLNQGAGTLLVASAPFVGSNTEYGYFVYLSNDSYVTAYPVISSSTTTLVLGGSLPANGTYGWVLKGIPKGMLWNLNNFELNFEAFGRTQKDYSSSDGGNE